MQRFFLIFLILFCIYRPAFSDVTFEGANNEIVILTGFIETEELDEMLAEIKIKKPKQIILDSYGGDTQSARHLAQYIHDNNISTYVSEVAVCKSACVILFLAGKKRLCEGELGVHQGYLPKDEENEKVKIKYALEAIQKQQGRLVWQGDPRAGVLTAGALSWRSLWTQRGRWASKTTRLDDRETIFIAVLIGTVQCTLLAWTLASLVLLNLPLGLATLALWAVKMMLDFRLLKQVNSAFKIHARKQDYITFAPRYLIMVLGAWGQILRGRVVWKGRRI